MPFLILAILFEIAWATTLKNAGNDVKFFLLNLLLMAMSDFLLYLSMRTIAPPTAYAIWVGCGVIGCAVISHFLGDSTLTIKSLIPLMLISAGVLSFKLL